MNISVTPANAEFVERLVDSGRYHTASEVFRDGLRLLERTEHQRLLEKWLLQGLTTDEEKQLPEGVLDRAKAHIKSLVQEGMDQLDRGEGIPGDQVFREIQERSKQRRTQEKHG